jgi:hypothetical protein
LIGPRNEKTLYQQIMRQHLPLETTADRGFRMRRGSVRCAGLTNQSASDKTKRLTDDVECNVSDMWQRGSSGISSK